MAFELITDDTALADLCRSLAAAEWLTLDTEFLRERTYRARLCLVQVAGPDVVAVIDPLAIHALEPLAGLLHAGGLRKVLHAARQDLEVFFDLHQRVPAPVFDTQIAAALCGYADQIGYATLVRELTGIELDKSQTRTNWTQRPLTANQLRYAAEDVEHLRIVYSVLRERLAARGRLAWVETECAALTNPARYRAEPDDAWRRLRGGAELTPEQQQVLRALAAWREREAQARDLPRAWVVRDDALFELARRMPQSATDLAGVGTLDERARRRHAERLLAAVAEGRRADPVPLWSRTAPLTAAETTLVKQILAGVREFAESQSIAASLLVTRRDVEQAVRGADPAGLWPGWRGELLLPLIRPLLAEAAAKLPA